MSALTQSRGSPVSVIPIPLLNIPLTSLSTANETDLAATVANRNVIIDFWTTKCVKCPAALTALNTKSLLPSHANLKIISICCDSLDGAREILEENIDLKWNNVSHFYTDTESKEKAKEYYGFKSVPFYILIGEDGVIKEFGNSKQIDLDNAPGVIREEGDSVPAFIMPTTPIMSRRKFGTEIHVNTSHNNIPSVVAISPKKEKEKTAVVTRPRLNFDEFNNEEEATVVKKEEVVSTRSFCMDEDF